MPSADSDQPAELAALVARSARAWLALDDAACSLVSTGRIEESLRAAAERGWFRPDEEGLLVDWQSRFLTVRAGLWEVVEELRPAVGERLERLPSERVRGDRPETADERRWRAFLIGYAAACTIVRLDRALLDSVAVHPVVARKLDEGSVERRIPRKQYTAVYRSFTDPRVALAMLLAMRAAGRARSRLAALADDPVVGEAARRLDELEAALDPSRRRYLERLARYRDHSLRRRLVSAGRQAAFAALERSGRAASELQDRWTPKRVTAEVREELVRILRPGDVLVTRHERAFTNLFLPGYWPHAALYVGAPEDHERLGVVLDGGRHARWDDHRRTLEALKDGVQFRRLEETLAVDAVAVIRPRLAPAELAEAIGRACRHEGRLYDFDFDFFRSDRLVCTEVVYRGFDGVGGIEIPLRMRADRPTLAAEDLLDLALEGQGFEPVAVFAPGRCGERVAVGDRAAQALHASYRER